MNRRVVITGMGAVTPAGNTWASTWDAMLTGRTGIGFSTLIQASNYRTRLSAEVKHFSPETYVQNRKLLKQLVRADQFCIGAAVMALADAGLDPGTRDPFEGGLFLGTSKEAGPPERLFEALDAGTNGGQQPLDLRRCIENALLSVPPFYIIENLPNACIHYLSERYALRGANTCYTTTGAAGAQAIGDAFRYIRDGICTYALAGGFDSYTEWFPFSQLMSFEIMSTRNDDPATACRPFDRDRDGTVLGEGAGILVLEDLEHALARGARIYAEVVGYGCTAEATSIGAPDMTGEAVTSALLRALDDAGLTVADLNYINAYGNGTVAGDESEARGLQVALADRISSVAVSSTKPITGHMVAASGPVELMACVQAIVDGIVPGTLNCDVPDAGIDLDLVREGARQWPTRVAASISRGLGGQTVALVVKAYQHSGTAV